MRLRLRPQYFSRLAVTFALCFTAGKLGLSVAFTSGNVSPVWPPSGIALAATLLWGYRVWPGVAMASFLVNLLSPVPALAAPIIALGSTSSALVGAYLLQRFTGLQPSLTRLRDALGLVTLPAFVSTTLAASMGITGLLVAHVKPWSGFGSAWLVWWLGDAMGVLIVAPLVLTGGELVKTLRGYRWLELGLLSTGLVVVCLAIFGDQVGPAIRDDVLAFVVFPFVIWAAIRFGVAGSSAASFLTAALAVWGTTEGYGPFVKHDSLHNAALLQLFIAVTSITGLILAAVVTERKYIGEAFETKESMLAALKWDQYSLREERDSLGMRFRIRSAELAESKRALEAEINERIQAKEALEQQSVTLREQSHLLDLANDAIFVRSLDGAVSYWNEGAERLYGWTKQEALGSRLTALLRTEFPVPLEDIKAALIRDGSWEGEIVHTRRDGRRITVASRWILWRDQDARPVGWLQINRDISNIKRTE
jgi:PAS domain S-box-containing protein